MKDATFRISLRSTLLIRTSRLCRVRVVLNALCHPTSSYRRGACLTMLEFRSAPAAKKRLKHVYKPVTVCFNGQTGTVHSNVQTGRSKPLILGGRGQDSGVLSSFKPNCRFSMLHCSCTPNLIERVRLLRKSHRTAET